MKPLRDGGMGIKEISKPLASIDIPHMCSSDGHELQEKGSVEEVLWFKVVVRS